MQTKKNQQINQENNRIYNWEGFFKTKWIIPFILLVLLVSALSLKLLSDQDTGFHLKAGKWIIENHSFPQKDTFTYTVNNNDYIDLHWLFQIIIYGIYTIFSYDGLSFFVMLLSLILLILLILRNQINKIPLSISCFVMLFGFLIIEQRLILRPEMLTFIYITGMLIILELYYKFQKNVLYLLPIIMLFWCNTQGLFILGIIIIGSYFFTLFLKEKKINKKFLFWSSISVLACLINPYFIKGFVFPLELLTRFDNNNIFKQHISELKSFSSINKYVLKDYLFIAFSSITFVITAITIRKRHLYEFILLLLFFYLALSSIRNIPLFIIIAIPIISISTNEILINLKEKNWFSKIKFIKYIVYFLMIIVTLGFILQIYTGAYYINNSYSKFGIGLDKEEQPIKACEFLNKNQLDGKLINSIGYGGWLSWNLSQPIFIDGRLEVIKEQLYQEVTNSWNGGLANLIDKYNPKLIVYNYTKYLPWTIQLNKMQDWRIIYLDNEAAIYAYKDYTTNIKSINFANLPLQYNLSKNTSEQIVINTLNLKPTNKYIDFIESFYKKTDNSKDLLNIASFLLQIKEYKIAEQFFLEELKKNKAKNNFIYYGLAEIYKKKGDNNKLDLCLSKIKYFNNTNRRKNLE